MSTSDGDTFSLSLFLLLLTHSNCSARLSSSGDVVSFLSLSRTPANEARVVSLVDVSLLSLVAPRRAS